MKTMPPVETSGDIKYKIMEAHYLAIQQNSKKWLGKGYKFHPKTGVGNVWPVGSITPLKSFVLALSSH